MSPTDFLVIFGGILAILLIILIYFTGRHKRTQSKNLNRLTKVSKTPKNPTGLIGQTFTSTIAGVTFHTTSGQNRQTFIKRKLKVGDALLFRHELNNKYDSDAIAIHTLDGFHLGYVKSGIFYGTDGENLIIRNMEAGIKVRGRVKDIYSTSDEAVGVAYDIYL